MKNKRYRAFSLVEMLVVLAITAALILLGFPPARQTWQSTQERIFWHRFDTEWDRTVQYMTANKSARLCFYRDEVVFMRGSVIVGDICPTPTVSARGLTMKSS